MYSRIGRIPWTERRKKTNIEVLNQLEVKRTNNKYHTNKTAKKRWPCQEVQYCTEDPSWRRNPRTRPRGRQRHRLMNGINTWTGTSWAECFTKTRPKLPAGRDDDDDDGDNKIKILTEQWELSLSGTMLWPEWRVVYGSAECNKLSYNVHFQITLRA